MSALVSSTATQPPIDKLIVYQRRADYLRCLLRTQLTIYESTPDKDQPPAMQTASSSNYPSTRLTLARMPYDIQYMIFQCLADSMLQSIDSDDQTLRDGKVVNPEYLYGHFFGALATCRTLQWHTFRAIFDDPGDIAISLEDGEDFESVINDPLLDYVQHTAKRNLHIRVNTLWALEDRTWTTGLGMWEESRYNDSKSNGITISIYYDYYINDTARTGSAITRIHGRIADADSHYREPSFKVAINPSAKGVTWNDKGVETQVTGVTILRDDQGVETQVLEQVPSLEPCPWLCFNFFCPPL